MYIYSKYSELHIIDVLTFTAQLSAKTAEVETWLVMLPHSDFILYFYNHIATDSAMKHLATHHPFSVKQVFLKICIIITMCRKIVSM